MVQVGFYPDVKPKQPDDSFGDKKADTFKTAWKYTSPVFDIFGFAPFDPTIWIKMTLGVIDYADGRETENSSNFVGAVDMFQDIYDPFHDRFYNDTQNDTEWNISWIDIIGEQISNYTPVVSDGGGVTAGIDNSGTIEPGHYFIGGTHGGYDIRDGDSHGR